MTRLNDLSLEEQAVYEARLAATLTSVDLINAGLDERAERRRADRTDVAERYAARQRQQTARAAVPDPAPPAPQPPPRDWGAAERRWVAQIIDAEIAPLVEEIGKAVARADNRIDALETGITKSEEATVELLRELERKVEELRERAITKPQRPRLVSNSGGSDAGA